MSVLGLYFSYVHIHTICMCVYSYQLVYACTPMYSESSYNRQKHLERLVLVVLHTFKTAIEWLRVEYQLLDPDRGLGWMMC